MSSHTHSDTPAVAPTPEQQVSSSDEDQASPDQVQKEPTPWILRPRVRVSIYLSLALFLLATISWGIIPRLLDPTFEKHIQESEVMVGMTREQVLQAWGSPYQTNISHTSEGIRREEWIFEDWISAGEVKHRYLYFEEGVLVGGWR